MVAIRPFTTNHINKSMEEKKIFKNIVGYATLYLFNPIIVWGWLGLLIWALYLGCSRVSDWGGGNIMGLIGAIIACLMMLCTYPVMTGLSGLVLTFFMIGTPGSPAIVMGMVAAGILWFAILKNLFDDYELGFEFIFDLVECHKTNHDSTLEWMKK